MWLRSSVDVAMVWCRLAAAAPVLPLALESPYATDVALKKGKETGRRKEGRRKEETKHCHSYRKLGRKAYRAVGLKQREGAPHPETDSVLSPKSGLKERCHLNCSHNERRGLRGLRLENLPCYPLSVQRTLLPITLESHPSFRVDLS